MLKKTFLAAAAILAAVLLAACGDASKKDEKAADAFVGGLVAYTEQFIVDMSEER